MANPDRFPGQTPDNWDDSDYGIPGGAIEDVVSTEVSVDLQDSPVTDNSVTLQDYTDGYTS